MSRTLAAIAILILAATIACAAPIEWPMDDQSEIVSAVGMDPGRVQNGKLVGLSAWDPHFTLGLPKSGLDADELTWLETRLYSSEPADLLDIYYQSADGKWCLGGKFPIAKGWAVYRIDLTQNTWRETTTGPDSRQWGGPSKQVSSFRLDPGNEAGRTILVDYVKLLPKPEGAVEGVTVEPMGKATLRTLTAPARAQAGATLKVSAAFDVQLPENLTSVTTYVRLRHGDEVMVTRENLREVAGAKSLSIAADLPLSAYWYPDDYVVEVGAYELEPAAGSKPAVAAIKLANARVGAVKPPVVKLQRLGGDAAIMLNGKPLGAMMMSFHGGDAFKLHREVGSAGMHVYADWFGASTNADIGHVAPDKYDYSAYDKYFANILAADPQALFLPHIGVTAPLWWQKAHPEELCEYADGKKGPSSLASLLWRQEMGEDLRKLLTYLRQAPYADRLIGYTFYSGYTAEWQMWGTWTEHRDDYSAPATRAFREFLTKRYATDAALQKAWTSAQVTLATATVPTEAQRWPEGLKGPQVLRDPATEQQSLDWYEFASNMDAEALLHFAKITREATNGEALVGTYYAYLSAHGQRQADSGHCAAARVFDSPYIDFLMSPPNYAFRKAGETSTFMSATDSFRLRGKLWIDEADNRTFLSDVSAGFGRSDNLPDSLGVFFREHAEVLTKRAGVSYFDMSGGWYSDPKLLSALGQAVKLSAQSLQSRQPFTPEVCLLVDPDSFYSMRPSPALVKLVQTNLVTAPQSGLPFDYCLVSDLGQQWFPDYKLYVFLNAVRVDAKTREIIAAKLKRNNATAVFLYAPGYFADGDNGSVTNMEKLTGIKFTCDPTPGPTQLELSNTRLSAGLDVSKPLGTETPVAPRFIADDPQAQEWGKLSGTDKPGLVMKRNNGWTAIYSSSIELPPALLRNLARQAGAHVYTDSDDATYADTRYIGVHAATEGEKTVHLPRPCRVKDALTGKELPVEKGTVRFTLRRGETRLLEMVP
jgi:hypothetical protein